MAADRTEALAADMREQLTGHRAVAALRDQVADLRARVRALDFRLIRERTPEEYAEIRRWIEAGGPDRWPAA
jgi:hypothetical protein